MAEHRPHIPPSEPDGDGVRVVPKPRGLRRVRPWVAVITVVAAAAWFVLTQGQGQGPRQGLDAAAALAAVDDEVAATADGLPRSARPLPTTSAQEPPPMPSNDPNDLAAYFQPGDPEPTGAEVITALQDAGVRTGLGAFNPPGTSPPLEGLAVPDGFKLPEGYVRHHQVTDEGVPIEPILMFSP
ncbi:MAG: hypothetical protein ACREPE_13900, partial [Lysobacter sp.]